VKPIGQCLYRPSVSICNSHAHFYLIAYLKVGTPDKKEQNSKSANLASNGHKIQLW